MSNREQIRKMIVNALIMNATDEREKLRLAPDHIMTASVPDSLMVHLTYTDLDDLEKIHHIIAKTPKEWES